MSPRIGLLLLCGVSLFGSPGCGHSEAARREAARPAVLALSQGDFDRAQGEAGRVLKADDGNAQAAAVEAITRYKKAMHQLSTDLRGAIAMIERGGVMDHRYVRFALQTAVDDLDRVDADLAAAATDATFSLELCLACWKVDWNQSGAIDGRDETLFQIEIDEAGNELPDGDPRRTPTFRFDVGDLHWARAMVAFQRAILELLLAYDWSALNMDSLRATFSDKKPLRIAAFDKKKFARVRELLRFALDEADVTRLAYLAETDDDREWVPNPRQKSHPMPLPVDQALYDTWAGVVGDLRDILDRKAGLSVAELAQLGKRKWDKPPGGFIDIGGLLSEPRDIVIDVSSLADEDFDRGERVEAHLASFLGAGYAKQMAPSKLISRLVRMRYEVDRGTESIERKLRYLFWLN